MRSRSKCPSGLPFLLALSLVALARWSPASAAESPAAVPALVQLPTAPMPSSVSPGLKILTPPTSTVRARATELGFLAGAATGAAAGVVVGVAICRIDTDIGPVCPASLDYVLPILAGSVLVGSAGALVGSLIGSGIPRWRRADASLSFWERATGEIGALSLGLGAATIVSGAPGGSSGGVRLGYFVKLGSHPALGAEVGYYRFGQRVLVDARGLGTPIERAAWHLNAAVRIHTPAWRMLRPYVIGGLGLYAYRWEALGYDEYLGGSVAVGVEWRFLSSLAASLEARLHATLEDAYEKAGRQMFATGTAGVTWSW